MKRAGRPSRTIKELVFDHIHRRKGAVSYDDLTREVLLHFPTSAWKRSHWAWYSYQIRSGKYRNEFTELECANLAPSGRTTEPKRASLASIRRAAEPKRASLAPVRRAAEPDIKQPGDGILREARRAIAEAAGSDPVLRFRLNRWVFSRLQLDERRLKQPVKQALWDAGARSCHICGEAFASLTTLHLHRKDPKLDYTASNCVLLHARCHRTLK